MPAETLGQKNAVVWIQSQGLGSSTRRDVPIPLWQCWQSTWGFQMFLCRASWFPGFGLASQVENDAFASSTLCFSSHRQRLIGRVVSFDNPIRGRKDSIAFLAFSMPYSRADPRAECSLNSSAGQFLLQVYSAKAAKCFLRYCSLFKGD